MFKHKYIAARIDRRTYLKGSFRGKFVGRLDPSKSDPRHERYYDLEITEGEIETRQDHLVPWMEDKEPSEFSGETLFPTRLPGKIDVTLHCLNGEIRHFKIALKQIRLMDCHLSRQVYSRNEVFGTIDGLVSGYILHHDMLVKEIAEEEIKREAWAPSEKTAEGRKRPASPVDGSPGSNARPSPNGLRLLKVIGILLATGLLVAAFLIAANWMTVLSGALALMIGIRWLRKWTSGRYGPRISGTLTALVIALAVAGTALYVANSYQNNIRQAPADNTGLKDEATRLLAQGRYLDALLAFNQLLATDENNPSLLYQRAVCYSRIGKIAEAVADLKGLVSGGDAASIALHDSINPLKKRKTGTVIRCNDGTISNSKHRRGTCSHHGGVKNWEEPVYQEYREYE